MASDRSQKKGKDKWKEKTWYTVVSPDFLGGKDIATSPALTPENMIGRKIELPVSDITGNFKKGTSRVVLKISSCEGSRCKTDFLGHYVSDDSVRRMVRRRRDRIDSYVRAVTSDNYRIILKSVIVADSKLTSSRRVDVRLSVEKFLSEKISGLTLSEAATYVIGDDIYNDVVDAIRSIYPIKKVEIRKSEVSKVQVSEHEMPEVPVEA